MQLIRGRHNLEAPEGGCVATIGNFDGMHLGHQAVIRQVVEEADRRGLPAMLVTFEPLPHEYFAPDRQIGRLTTLRRKLDLLEGLGLDYVFCLNFNPSLARMPAERFIREILVDGLQLRHLVVGDDFRFGRGREGDFAMLRAAGERFGFSVERTRTLALDGERVSSTRIRRALDEGRMDEAARLLGRRFSFSGRVAHGDKRGRQIGFHTANIHLRRGSPVRGVFAVRVLGADDRPVAGVANVGRRPTVEGERMQLEVHLLDFQGELYGRRLKVELLHRIRDERRFDSLDALVEQIHRDVARAREFFARHPQAQAS